MVWFWLVAAVVLLVLIGYFYVHTFTKRGRFYNSRAGVRLPIWLGIIALSYAFGMSLGQLSKIWF